MVYYIISWLILVPLLLRWLILEFLIQDVLLILQRCLQTNSHSVAGQIHTHFLLVVGNCMKILSLPPNLRLKKESSIPVSEETCELIKNLMIGKTVSCAKRFSILSSYIIAFKCRKVSLFAGSTLCTSTSEITCLGPSHSRTYFTTSLVNVEPGSDATYRPCRNCRYA